MGETPSQQVDLYARDAASFRERPRRLAAMMGWLDPGLVHRPALPCWGCFETRLQPNDLLGACFRGVFQLLWPVPCLCCPTNLMPVVVLPRLCPRVVCGGANHICHQL